MSLLSRLSFVASFLTGGYLALPMGAITIHFIRTGKYVTAGFTLLAAIGTIAVPVYIERNLPSRADIINWLLPDILADRL